MPGDLLVQGTLSVPGPSSVLVGGDPSVLVGGDPSVPVGGDPSVLVGGGHSSVLVASVTSLVPMDSAAPVMSSVPGGTLVLEGTSGPGNTSTGGCSLGHAEQHGCCV